MIIILYLNHLILAAVCMIIDSSVFINSGGFDERYFLYLEDADLTRSLSNFGRCIHFPYSQITHKWGRGNYKEYPAFSCKYN